MLSEYQIKLNRIKLGLEDKTTGPKPKKAIPKKSAKRAAQEAEQRKSGDSKLDKWFEEMREWCTGKCVFCNGSTPYRNKELWRIAIAHLLPKAKFKSIATNENNWIELCWDCHTNFDSGKITWEMLFDSHEWLTIKEQLKLILPLVAPEEHKYKLYSKLMELVNEQTPLSK